MRVKLDIDGTLGILTMNHPEAMNAMGAEMREDFITILDEVEYGGAGLRALMITGEGRAFCSGANLTETRQRDLENKSKAPVDFGRGLETGYHPILRRLRDLPMPIVAAVNGAAAGIGMSFALMGDMVLASKSAFFLQAFRRIGLVADGGATWLLPRLVGVARAKEMSLMGERIPAEKALAWGMINRVYDDAVFMSEATKLAKELANGPTTALTLMRGLFRDSLSNSYEEQLDLEREGQKIAGRTSDRVEGVTAFIEKREAKFTGK